MRLLVFLSCGRRDALPEELAPLPRAVSPAPEKRRRRTIQSAAPSWRPSLGPISEDGVPVPVPPPPQSETLKGGGRTVRSASKRGRSADKVRSRADRDEYRYLGIPAVVPAFAPTAFIF